MEAQNKKQMEAKPPSRNGEQIIRQSQLERAIDLYKLWEIKPTLRQVLRLSQILTDFQYDWRTDKDSLKKFEEHLQKDFDLWNKM